MIVQLGYTRANDRKIDKDFTVIRELNCTIRGSITLLNPNLLVSYHQDIAECNYMYIPEWERYYFIDGITMVPGQMSEIRGSVDVLMSFSNQIKNMSVFVSRAENLESPFFADPNMEAEVASNVQVDTLSGPFYSSNFPETGRHYLFTVLGGSDNSN